MCRWSWRCRSWRRLTVARIELCDGSVLHEPRIVIRFAVVTRRDGLKQSTCTVPTVTTRRDTSEVGVIKIPRCALCFWRLFDRLLYGQTPHGREDTAPGRTDHDLAHCVLLRDARLLCAIEGRQPLTAVLGRHVASLGAREPRRLRAGARAERAVRRKYVERRVAADAHVRSLDTCDHSHKSDRWSAEPHAVAARGRGEGFVELRNAAENRASPSAGSSSAGGGGCPLSQHATVGQCE